ncbi:hypothetical protein CsSME_00046265 [Camellia sinensis var. sinensis]
MTIEARLVDQRRDKNVGHVDKIIRKKKFHRRTKRPTGLQRLFVSCKEVFRGHGIVPSPSDVQKLCHILGEFDFEITIIYLDWIFMDCSVLLLLCFRYVCVSLCVFVHLLQFKLLVLWLIL